MKNKDCCNTACGLFNNAYKRNCAGILTIFTDCEDYVPLTIARGESVPAETLVMPKIAEVEKENKKFKKAIKKIHQAGVCGNNHIGKWGLEEYCYNLLNDSSFSA